MTTTREQRLRELVEKWREECRDQATYNVDERCTYSVCYRELAAILDEPVEVTDEMVKAIRLAYFSGPTNSLSPTNEKIRRAITACLKEACK